MEFAHHLNYTANNSFFLISFFHIPGNKNYVMLNDIKIIQKHGGCALQSWWMRSAIKHSTLWVVFSVAFCRLFIEVNLLKFQVA